MDSWIQNTEAGCSEAAVRDEYRKLTKLLIKKGMTLTTMESCTSGLIVSLVTDTEGASAVVKGAYVTYSNEAKLMQGVPTEVIERYGVYSKETAAAMAAACRKSYGSDIGIGVTGTLGNVDVNNADSVPGQVYFAIDLEGSTCVYEQELKRWPTRYQYKLEIAGLVVRKLLEKLDR